MVALVVSPRAAASQNFKVSGTLGDGGTFSGTLSIDTTNGEANCQPTQPCGAVTNWNITVTPQQFPGFDFTTSNSVFFFEPFAPVFPSPCHDSLLVFASPFTASLSIFIQSSTLVGFAGSALVPQGQCPSQLNDYNVVVNGSNQNDAVVGGSITPSCQVSPKRKYGQYNYSPKFSPPSAENNPTMQYQIPIGDVPQYFGFLPNPNLPINQNHPYVLCPTIRSGCALTAAATMLTSFSSLNPTATSLDFLLRTPGQLGYNDAATIPMCPLNLPNCTSGLVPFLDWCEFDWPGLQFFFPFSIAMVDSQQTYGSSQLLDNGTPVSIDQYLNDFVCTNQDRVILQLSDSASSGQHYIFVTGQTPDGSDWDIFDPGWATAPSTLRGELNPNGFQTISSKGQTVTHRFNVAGVRTYADISPTGNTGAFSVSATSPIELLVVDPLGRDLGHLNGTDVFGIPHGSYTRDFPYADDDSTGLANGDPSGIKQAHIPSPLAGTYSVTSTGTGLGIYTLTFRMLSTDGTWQAATVAGLASVGSISTYQVFYSPITNSSGSVTLLATFQSARGDISSSLALGLIDNQGIANSLSRKIDAASAAAGRGDTTSQANNLRAFIAEVAAQTGKHLNGIASQVLLSDANSLLSEIP